MGGKLPENLNTLLSSGLVILGKLISDLTNKTGVELNGVVYYVERLHKVPHLINECCDLINLEWKRSHTARLRSIEGSCENFPMSLLLLRNTPKSDEVIGHCKISRLSMSTTKVFVETVVIHPLLRNKGLGKVLMNETEKICRSKNIKWIYLATKGQEGFYEKLGYIRCPPISIYGCQEYESDEYIEKSQKQVKPVLNSTNINITNVPPPPPLPQNNLKIIINNMPSSKTFLRKYLSE